MLGSKSRNVARSSRGGRHSKQVQKLERVANTETRKRGRQSPEARAAYTLPEWCDACSSSVGHRAGCPTVVRTEREVDFQTERWFIIAERARLRP